MITQEELLKIRQFKPDMGLAHLNYTAPDKAIMASFEPGDATCYDIILLPLDKIISDNAGASMLLLYRKGINWNGYAIQWEGEFDDGRMIGIGEHLKLSGYEHVILGLCLNVLMQKTNNE